MLMDSSGVSIYSQGINMTCDTNYDTQIIRMPRKNTKRQLKSLKALIKRTWTAVSIPLAFGPTAATPTLQLSNWFGWLFMDGPAG